MLQNETARQCGRDGKYVMGCPGMLKIARLFVSPDVIQRRTTMTGYFMTMTSSVTF